MDVDPLPLPFVFRSFRADQDVSRLSLLLDAVEAVDGGGRDTSEEALRGQLALPGHDPARDRWVVVAPGDADRLIGYGLVWVPEAGPAAAAEVAVVVHPAWRRQGLGSALLSRAVAHACTLGAVRATGYLREERSGGPSFLAAHGFDLSGAYTEMRAAGSIVVEAPAWPAGCHLRSHAEVGDVPLLAQAMTDCYEGLWAHTPVSAEEMAAWLAEWDADGLLLLFDAHEQAVGISRVECSRERSARNGRPTGYIDAPGILPELRSPDLYFALLAAGIQWLQARGQALLELESWGDDPAILKLYVDAGFATLRRILCYERDL